MNRVESEQFANGTIASYVRLSTASRERLAYQAGAALVMMESHWFGAKNGNGFDRERNFRSNMRMVVAVVKKNSFDLSETEGSFKNLASVICLEAHRHTHARLIYAAPEDLLARNGPCQNKIIICSIYHGSQRR